MCYEQHFHSAPDDLRKQALSQLAFVQIPLRCDTEVTADETLRSVTLSTMAKANKANLFDYLT